MVMMIYKISRFLAKLFCVGLIFLLAFRGYGLYHYTYVLQENTDFKTSVKTPVLTRFSEGDMRLNHQLSSQLNAYVINLDRSTDRWNTIKPKLDMMHIPYYRLSAVDGKAIPNETLRMSADDNKSKELFGRLLKGAEIGCYLSHYFAIQDFMASSSSYALILEDDLDFSPQELTRVIQDLLHVKDKWDIANLYTTGGVRKHKTVTTLPRDERSLVYFTTRTHMAVAYLLNRKAGQALLQKSLPVVLPYDWVIIREWDLGIKYRGVLPIVGKHHDLNYSNISSDKRPLSAESGYSRYTSQMFEYANRKAHYYNNFLRALW